MSGVFMGDIDSLSRFKELLVLKEENRVNVTSCEEWILLMDICNPTVVSRGVDDYHDANLRIHELLRSLLLSLAL